MVAPSAGITLEVARELAVEPKRKWTEFHLDARGRVAWFVRDQINLGVNYRDGTVTVEFCTHARLKKRVKLGRCDADYLLCVFHDPFTYAKRESWYSRGSPSIKKESARLKSTKNKLRQLLDDHEKRELRKKRFGMNNIGVDDKEKLASRLKRFGSNEKSVSIAATLQSCASVSTVPSTIRTETVVKRIRKLVFDDAKKETDGAVSNSRRDYPDLDKIERERSSADVKGSKIFVHGCHNLINFVRCIEPMNAELLTISPDGLGSLYYSVESSEYLWQDAQRVSFGISMLNLLNSTVRERAQCLSVGVNKRYFLQRTNGQSYYRGPEILAKVANAGSKVKCVAFGSSYDSVVILCKDGRIMKTEHVPSELQDVLELGKEVEFVSMGPQGEWFVRMEGDDYLYGGLTQEMKESLDSCGPKLKEVTFGTKAFIARYD